MNGILYKRSNIIGFLGFTIAAFGLSACGLVPSSPHEPPQTFILDAEFPDGTVIVKPKKLQTGILLINMPRPQAGFDTPRMAYSQRAYQISYYALNQWADTPAKMLLPVLTKGLEKTKIWRSVVQMPSSLRGTYQLDSQNLILQQEFFHQPSRVRLSLWMQLIDLQAHRVTATRAFTVFEEMPHEDAYGGVIAANHALERLLKQISEWLIVCMDELASGNC